MLFFTATETSDVVYQLRMSCELGEATNVPQVRALFRSFHPALTRPGLKAGLSCVSSHLALFVALVSRTNLLRWSRTRGCGG